jgi:hypothetical protein
MPFEENSYLGKQIEKIRNDNIVLNQEILTTANNINKEINKLLYTLRHTDDINRDYFIIALFCKIVTSYNAIVILQNYGLSSDAKTILRSMMESTFHLRAIIFSDTYLDDYIKKANSETLRLMKNIKNNTEFFTDEIINHVTESKISEVEDAIKEMNSISIRKLAELADMKQIYLYTYNNLSLDTHGNAKAIRDNFLYEETSGWVFNMVPNFKDLKYVLVTAFTLIIYSLEGFDKYFDNDYAKLIDDIKTMIKPYLI